MVNEMRLTWRPAFSREWKSRSASEANTRTGGRALTDGGTMTGKSRGKQMKSITVFLVALVVAAPVAAQSIIPRERPATVEREGKSSGDIARKTMDQFAACVLDRRRKSLLHEVGFLVREGQRQ